MKINILFINILSKTIHEGVVTTLIEDYSSCNLLFTSSISQNIKVKSHDCFESLIELRIELEKQGYYLLCNGARKDVYSGGMLREASCGCWGYIMKLGKIVQEEDEVYIFDYAEPDLVGSVSEQKKNYNLCLGFRSVE
jgi:hypothetical protein